MMPNLGPSVAKGDIREGGNHETVQRGKHYSSLKCQHAAGKSS